MYPPHLVDRLPGPEWLRRLRADHAARVVEQALPTEEAEEWRYSPIEDLVLERFAPVLDPPPASGLPEIGFAAESVAARIVTVDGFAVFAEARDAGVEILRATDATEPIEMLTGSDLFSEANVAFAPEPVVIRVRPGSTVDGVVVVDHRFVGDGVASFPRIRVEAGADAEVSIVESYRCDEAASLSVPVTEISVGAAARVRYQRVQDLGVDMWQLASMSVDVDQQALFEGGVASVGGGYARLRADCRLTGRGSTGNLRAVYFADGDQTLDFRVFQDHVGRDTNSDLAFKGVVDDSATSIYTGLIRVGEDAAGTVAHQANRAIKLSDSAWAESVPNLEIENNDVRCSHASTVGPVGAEALFYLESRGVPTEVAERLVVEGFLADVVSAMPVPAVRPWLMDLVQAKLDDGRAS